MLTINSNKKIIIFFLTAFLFLISVSAESATVLQADDMGWYRNDGLHTPANKNYLAGDYNENEYRNWFVFDISGMSEYVDNAVLRAYMIEEPPLYAGYQSPDTWETWRLFDVATGIDSLVGGTGGPGAFNDLGTGTVYGFTDVSLDDNGSFVEVNLNSHALSAINSASGLFAIGGAVVTLDNPLDERIFWFSDMDYRVELAVNSVPIPGTAILLFSGIIGMLSLKRKKYI